MCEGGRHILKHNKIQKIIDDVESKGFFMIKKYKLSPSDYLELITVCKNINKKSKSTTINGKVKDLFEQDQRFSIVTNKNRIGWLIKVKRCNNE